MKQIEMNLKEKEDEKKKMTSTAFLLLFPVFLIAGIAIMYAPIAISIIALGLAIYQLLMFKKFIADYYQK